MYRCFYYYTTMCVTISAVMDVLHCYWSHCHCSDYDHEYNYYSAISMLVHTKGKLRNLVLLALSSL